MPQVQAFLKEKCMVSLPWQQEKYFFIFLKKIL